MDTLYQNDLWRHNKLAKDNAHGTNNGFDHGAAGGGGGGGGGGGAAWAEQIRNLAIWLVESDNTSYFNFFVYFPFLFWDPRTHLRLCPTHVLKK